MSKLPVHLLEGLVFERDLTYWVQTETGDVDLSAILSGVSGLSVSVSVHHLPPDPPVSTYGGGSCFWGELCPVGHGENPAWMFERHLKGTLTCQEGKYMVSGESLGLSTLLGHFSRVLVVVNFDPSEVSQDLESLQGEAQDLQDLLTSLMAHVQQSEEDNG